MPYNAPIYHQDLLQELISKKQLSRECAMDILFRFKIRSVTHLCNKSKLSLFKTTYKSQPEIHKLVLKEVSFHPTHVHLFVSLTILVVAI